jgi:hypothetical protein
MQLEELQQQVRVLQAVGYGAFEGGESPERGAGGAAASLEAALLAKARRLEHELTMTRVRLSETAGAQLDARFDSLLRRSLLSGLSIMVGSSLLGTTSRAVNMHRAVAY